MNDIKEIFNKILSVSNKELDSIDMGFMRNYQFFHDVSYSNLKSGQEHYRLLAYISKLFNKVTLYEIGTYRCVSAAALSSSMNNRVKSYDILKSLPYNPILPGVQFIIGDATEDEKLIKSNFIFLDVAHDGTYENKFYKHLHDIQWKGILLLDDIELNYEMKEFWNRINEEKHNIKQIGHWSSTGIVIFE